MMQRSTEPLVDFVIGGAQKAGTSALAHYLGRNPAVCLPQGKEAHVFDAPDFDDQATPEQLNIAYLRLFDPSASDTVHGDATPFYVFHPRVVARIAQYNPAMRWIVLLRDPVDRALSHFHMERARGNERRPFWLALLLERWRLRGHADDFARGSPLRRHSYRARSDYARQLKQLQAHFPESQTLLLRSADLMREPHATLGAVCRFLDIQELADDPGDYAPVFQGDYQPWPASDWRRRVLCWWWRRELEAQARLGLHWDMP